MTDILVDLVSDHWGKIVGVFGAGFSFFAGRKSKKNNETAGELENIKTVREIERSLLDDMEEQIKKLIQTNNTLEAIVRDQSKKIRAYEAEFGILKNYNK